MLPSQRPLCTLAVRVDMRVVNFFVKLRPLTDVGSTCDGVLELNKQERIASFWEIFGLNLIPALRELLPFATFSSPVFERDKDIFKPSFGTSSSWHRVMRVSCILERSSRPNTTKRPRRNSEPLPWGLTEIRKGDLALGRHRHEDGIGIIAARQYMRVRMDMGTSTTTGQCRADRTPRHNPFHRMSHRHFCVRTTRCNLRMPIWLGSVPSEPPFCQCQVLWASTGVTFNFRAGGKPVVSSTLEIQPGTIST
ncbi:hypothetical protein ARMGADRAFT_1079531 [Armillaria gallica]|uniref:Uncharacterized protein n=1 Tax=Armillaria gallica TaxID=47427 RepID=A0A2H3DFP7_ARMGA|nr:hypothetical protein ARMGADRAFT_1079531 [Armillaria gallica]